jgi:hypothetical protein
MKGIAGVFIILCLFSRSFSQDGTGARKSAFNLENGVALKGYDPVAYFTRHKAIKGKKEIFAVNDGITYQFESEANKQLYLKTPDAYEPAYGGWCAYAMGDTGEKVDIDPETFKVDGGRLFVFYNRFFNNTLPKWNKDEENLRRKADQNWKRSFH